MAPELEVDQEELEILDWTREFPILFQMRRSDGTVLLQHLVTSSNPWFGLTAWDRWEIDDIESLIVEYKLPGADAWKLAKANPGVGWTVDEGNRL